MYNQNYLLKYGPVVILVGFGGSLILTRSHVNRCNFPSQTINSDPASAKYLLSACNMMWTLKTTQPTNNWKTAMETVELWRIAKGQHSQIFSVACKAIRKNMQKNCICNIQSCIARLRNCMWSVVPFEVSGPPSFKPIPQNKKAYSYVDWDSGAICKLPLSYEIKHDSDWKESEKGMIRVLAAAWHHGFRTSANLIMMKPAKSTRSAFCFKKRSARSDKRFTHYSRTPRRPKNDLTLRTFVELLSATFSSSPGWHWISWHYYEALLQLAKCVFSKSHSLKGMNAWRSPFAPWQ